MKKNKQMTCRVGDLVAMNMFGNFDPYEIHEKYGIVILNSADAYNRYVTSILTPSSSKLIDPQDSGSFLVLWSTGLRRWHHIDELELINAAR
jgi:hypothetical protein